MAMTTNAKNTIILKSYDDIQIEKVANAAIKPGCLVYLMSTDKLAVHASAGQNVTPKMVAIENALAGGGIDTDYAAGDIVRARVLRAGDVAQLILIDAQSVSIGDKLESAGSGFVQKHTTDEESSAKAGELDVYPDQIVGIALEAVDTSESSGGESSGSLDFAKRIKVLIG